MRNTVSIIKWKRERARAREFDAESESNIAQRRIRKTKVN